MRNGTGLCNQILHNTPRLPLSCLFFKGLVSKFKICFELTFQSSFFNQN